MGYTPGLPPGLLINHNLETREISNIMESSGIKNEYLQTQKEINSIKRVCYLHHISRESTPEGVVNFIVENLTRRGLYSSPGVQPEVFKYDNHDVYKIIFPTEEDARNAVEINTDIRIYTSPIDIRPFRKQSEINIPPFSLLSSHPQRILVSNVDPSKSHEFESFLNSILFYDGIKQIDEIPDTFMVDVQPPMTPEIASRKLSGIIFGNFQLLATPMRQVTIPEDSDLPGAFNIPCENVDLQQILNFNSHITTGAETTDAYGRFLFMLNCVPVSLIQDPEESVVIISDITKELQKYGNIINVKYSTNPKYGAIGKYGVVVIEFENEDGAKLAQEMISGRRYLGRSVITINSPTFE